MSRLFVDGRIGWTPEPLTDEERARQTDQALHVLRRCNLSSDYAQTVGGSDAAYYRNLLRYEATVRELEDRLVQSGLAPEGATPPTTNSGETGSSLVVGGPDA